MPKRRADKATAELDAIIAEALATQRRAGRRCRCCEVKKVRELIARYFEMVDAGETVPNLTWFARRAVERQFSVSRGSVLHHARICLRRDL